MIQFYKIVETDNFDGDYPDEKFLNLPPLTKEQADIVAKAINDRFPETYARFWLVVPSDYILQPGFEP